MTTPQMDWLDDQRRKRAVSSDDIVRRMELMDVPPGSYDEETLYDAVAEIKRLRAERDASRAEVKRLRVALALACNELFSICDPLATSPRELMRHFLGEARRG